MSKTIAISQVGGTPAGSGGAATPANVTIGAITYTYIWGDGQQSSARRPTSLRLQIAFTKPLGWTGTGVHAYVEYPDQSATTLFKLGTSALGGGNQLGGSWKPLDLGQFQDDGSGFITLDLITIPDQTVNIRVYLVGYSALSDPAVVRATAVGASPSGVITVAPPPTFALGEENAQNVTGLTASTQYAVNSQGQLVLQLMVSWQPPDDPNFQGVFIYMHRPAQVVTAPPGTRTGTLQANALDVNSGLQVGTQWTQELSMFPVTTEFNTLYALSVDTSGNVNSIIVGTTPQVTVEIDPPPQGNAGKEFTSLVTNFTCSIGYPASGDGIENYTLSGSATIPTGDQTFGGYQVFAHDQANGTDHSQDWVLGTAATNGSYNFGPYPVQSTPSTLDIYAVSFDVNNNDNTIVPGTTPRVTGISPSLQTAGSLIGTRLKASTLDATLSTSVGGKLGVPDSALAIAKFASTIRPITLATSDPSLPDAHYPAGTYYFNTTSHTLKKVAASGSTWELGVNGGTDIIANTITGGQIVAGSISTTELNTTEIKVGGGGSKPGQFGVYDGSNVLIGWIGTNGGNVGAWFKTCRVGGSGYSTAPFQADSSGNVTINGATFTLTSNGITTTVDNSTFAGFPSGIQISDGTNVSALAAGVVTVAHSGVAKISASYSGVTGGNIEVWNTTGSHTSFWSASGLQFDGTQVLTSQQTGPGNTTDVTDVATRFNNLLTALRAHGLIT